MALAMLIASGRLVPRLLQRQSLTVSDNFLIISIFNTVGLFITDTLTYKWGGMAEDEGASEQSVADIIALKKVTQRFADCAT
jgi:hypothetical protein